ncbi:replication protein A 70 kDa DNA-binding subunit [Trifolium repens]|nr:replication protein A 70 kDa DNA-binding subunit [Trifolium repens]
MSFLLCCDCISIECLECSSQASIMVYNEKRKVELEVDDLADILAGKENVRIRVRIVRLWKVPSFVNPSDSISLEMVLVDENGGKIHASVRKQLIYMFESKLEEGHVYDMS